VQQSESEAATDVIEQMRLRGDPPEAGDEVSMLLGSLERERRTFAWKSGGLDAAGLRARLGPSAITLGGLLKHLALVEDYYFTVRLHGRKIMPPFDKVDFDADPEWEWRTAAEDKPEDLYDLWEEAVARGRSALKEALPNGGLDQVIQNSDWTPPPNLRRVVVDLVEEYSRHVGHADLIRESIDGRVGEDSPREQELSSLLHDSQP
jgi:hypothetical protein